MAENERTFRKRRREIKFTICNPRFTEDEIYFLIMFYKLSRSEQEQVYLRLLQICSEEQAKSNGIQSNTGNKN